MILFQTFKNQTSEVLLFFFTRNPLPPDFSYRWPKMLQVYIYNKLNSRDPLTRVVRWLIVPHAVADPSAIFFIKLFTFAQFRV